MQIPRRRILSLLDRSIVGMLVFMVVLLLGLQVMRQG